MVVLNLKPYPLISPAFNYSSTAHESHKTTLQLASSSANNFSRRGKLIKAVELTSSTTAETEPDISSEEEVEPPSIDFAFVSSVLLPDGTPDIQIRSACGGQKLRDIMLDNNIELYGPYSRALLNCAGGGTCGTCKVEVVEGKELLSLKTDKEKELLRKKPKTWRLACQTTVGKQDSRGQVVIQQLPEWKLHEWSYQKASAD